MNFIKEIYANCMGLEMAGSKELANFRSAIRQLSKSVFFLRAKAPLTRQKVDFPKLMDEVAKHRVVIFGEQHQQPDILKAQLCIMEGMASEREEKSNETGRQHSLSLVLEMFNFEQQKILDDFSTGSIRLDQLISLYQCSEGFDIQNHYGHLLEAARKLNIKLIAGFVPKELCSSMVKSGYGEKDEYLDSLLNYNVNHFYVEGTEEHYKYFQSLITGDVTSVSNRYRRIFPAQVLRDSSLAYKIQQCINESPDSQVLAICGSGHVDFHFGVPERIPSGVSVLVLTSRSQEDSIEENVADFVYQYQSSNEEFGEHFDHP